MSASTKSAVATAAFAAVAAIATIAGAAERKVTPAPAFTAKQLVELPSANWVTNGGNLTNQRYSTLKQIDTNNVKQLKGAWMTRLKLGQVGKVD